MKSLVTGGTGFIGSQLSLRCLEAGEAVRVLARPAAREKPAEQRNRARLAGLGAEIVEADLSDPVGLSGVADGCDVVYHLAAAQHEMNMPDSVFEAVNVEGTRRLLQVASGASVRRFVHGSTIGIYGQGASAVIDEGTPPAPDNVYGLTKLRGEEVVRSHGAELEWVIVRIPETYGPGDLRLRKLFLAVQAGRFFHIGSGRNSHHVIYVDDLVEVLRRAATSEAAVGQTILAAGPDAPTTNEMVAAVADAVGVSAPRVRLPLAPFLALAWLLEVTLRPLGIQPPLHRRRMDFFRKNFRFDTGLQERLLGFGGRVGFREGARRTWDWYRDAHPARREEDER